MITADQLDRWERVIRARCEGIAGIVMHGVAPDGEPADPDEAADLTLDIIGIADEIRAAYRDALAEEMR